MNYQSEGGDTLRGPSPVNDERREFICSCTRMLGIGAVLALAPPLLGGCEVSIVRSAGGPSEIVVDVTTLTADGQALATAENGPEGSPVLVVRKAADQYAAVSMSCTHEGCTVNTPSGGVISCPCHGSRFDLNGTVQNGPAVRSLTSYTTTYNAANGTVTIHFS
ncbi:MAG: Rieske 2Fe-2S domain-containing protein [Bacteroidetes bacterium]|nr:Rieske 2Fe-2S domain-containing protein [Bacteroidota bacterium]